MSVTSYLRRKGHHIFEGNSSEVPQQQEDLRHLSRKGRNSGDRDFTQKRPLKVMEIGFNAGHSAENFLKHNPDLTLLSFDLEEHSYVKDAKDYIDSKYPNRHILVLGSSTETVPKYVKDHPDETFDLIFIDGGHEYLIAITDVKNCQKLAHKETIVVVDDTVFHPPWSTSWTMGPTLAWKEALGTGLIRELGRKNYSVGRGIAWGNYVGL